MAAPTSTNEVTARRLTRLLVGSDGNGGLWKKVGDKVTNAIGALDVASVGGAGKYISAISETDGKISATATSMDTAPTASSTNAVTSGGVKTALDGKAPTSHASSATTYGVGTAANYGHVKLDNSTPLTLGTASSDGVATGKAHLHNALESTGRAAITTPDIEHVYTNNHAHMILSQITSNAGTTHDPGDGFVLSFMWDTSSPYDTQIYIPNACGASDTAFGRLKIRNRGINASTTQAWGDWQYLPAATTCTKLTSADDVNNLNGDAPGNVIGYYWESTSKPSNLPMTSESWDGMLFAYRTSPFQFGIQVAYRGTVGMYQRRLTNGTWSSWEKILVSSDITTGSTNGTISVAGTDVAVKGLGSAAYTASTAYATASHTHGNITNGGALQTNDITIANGDKLVVTDASDSNKVARTSISFDGSQYGYLLSKKGTWEYPKEAYLEWGGRNYNGSFGPLDAALVSELGANRLAFGKAAGITIEYTRDGGTTWIDYGASNELKSGLFSAIGKYGIVVGKADGNNKATTTENYLNYKVRVIIDASAFQIYNQFRKFVFYVSTNGSAGCYVVASGVSKSATTDTWTSLGEFNLQGWSGYNVFNKYIAIGTGGSADYKKVCFLFETRSAPTNQNYNGLAIVGILGFGGVGWTTPSTMAFTGHLYSYDGLQNAAFPAKVTAASFAGPLTGDVTGNLSGTATKADYLTGFTSRNTSNISWGTLTPANGYATVTEMRYTSGSQDPGAIAFGYKAGSGTSYDLSCQIDGVFYQREGGKRVLDESDLVPMTDQEVTDLLGAMSA